MFMSRFTPVACAAVLLAASASAQAVTLLDEGFSSVASLVSKGWVLTNASIPLGSTGWYQGDVGVFTSQTGDESYVAANFNSSMAGGLINNWLITPEFSTAASGKVSFWAKSDATGVYSDILAYGFSTGSSSINSFKLASATVVKGEWTHYTLDFGAMGDGSMARFGIAYFGPDDLASYVGIDTLTVTAVPEASTWMLFGGGLLGLAALRRRQAATRSA